MSLQPETFYYNTLTGTIERSCNTNYQDEEYSDEEEFDEECEEDEETDEETEEDEEDEEYDEEFDEEYDEEDEENDEEDEENDEDEETDEEKSDSSSESEFPYPESDDHPLYLNKRYFGEFKCDECHRWWMSANSWLGFGQDCQGCGQLVYPWRLSNLQVPLSGSDDDDDDDDDNEFERDKSHPQNMCERCKALGYYCRDSEYENVD